MLLVGLDVIGVRLTEVNVTSPTCFQEIPKQMGLDVAAMFVDALEEAMWESPFFLGLTLRHVLAVRGSGGTRGHHGSNDVV